MGQMRFLVSPPARLREEALDQAYLSGLDRTAWPVRARMDGAELVLERGVSDSANLNLLWEVEGHGLLVVTTATLIERPQPYHLPLELARGALSQLRNQLAEWQVAGLTIPEEASVKMATATERLSWAVVTQDGDPPASSTAAAEALQLALDGAQLLAQAYAEHAIAGRQRAGGKVLALLGGALDGPTLEDATAQQFLATFNAAQVLMPWREIETSEGTFSWSACDAQIDWCRAHGLRVCAGPLVQPDSRGLPDWVYLWEDDFDALMAAASQFVQAAVGRYRGKVDLWLCAARVNTAEVLALSEEERLRMAAAVVQLVRALDPGALAVISIDQPWGEYMSRREVDFPPLQFADALVRAGLDLKALMLEMNLGSFRGSTLPRSPLEFGRQLEYWSMLGLPLLVSLNVPSASGEDVSAQRRDVLSAGVWSPLGQQNWIARYAPLMLAKPSVQGVFWNQTCDYRPHEFPHAGLFDPQQHAKPALKTLASIRHAYLK
jgi:hypothetical protein